MQLTSYVAFDGNCQEAFKFYEKVLGGTIETMLDHGSTPMAAEFPPEWHSRIMHARLAVGGAVLMGADAPPDSYKKPTGFSVSIHVKSPAEADRIFHALAEGGTVLVPIAETFWSPRFGMLTDRFGLPWMVNCEAAA
jgi:PhnB protein